MTEGDTRHQTSLLKIVRPNAIHFGKSLRPKKIGGSQGSTAEYSRRFFDYFIME